MAKIYPLGINWTLYTLANAPLPRISIILKSWRDMNFGLTVPYYKRRSFISFISLSLYKSKSL